MPRYEDREVVLLKVESVERADSAPTGSANAVLVCDKTSEVFNSTEVERKMVLPYMGARPSAQTNKFISAAFKSEMAGSGTPAAPPAYGLLHRIAGMIGTSYSGAAGTIANSPPVGVDGPTGTFTYTKTAPYTGNRKRTVTLVCTEAGGTGVAEFTVSAPAAGNLEAYSQEGVVMTNATAFALGGGATITPTIGTSFAEDDEFTIELQPARNVLTPISTAFESATMHLIHDGALHAGRGCRAQVGWEVSPGMPYWTHKVNGLYTTPSTISLPTADFSAFKDPLPVEEANTPVMKLFGRDLKFMTFNGSNNAEVEVRFLANYADVPLSGRPFTGTLKFEAEALADINWFTHIEAGTTGALEFQHGDAAGAIVRIEADRVQVKGLTESRERKILYYELALKFLPSSAGNDEVRLITA